MLRLEKNKGVEVYCLRVFVILEKAFRFLLLVLLNNWSNLFILCRNVDIDKMLLPETNKGQWITSLELLPFVILYLGEVTLFSHFLTVCPSANYILVSVWGIFNKHFYWHFLLLFFFIIIIIQCQFLQYLYHMMPGRCLDVIGNSMITFRVLPHWNITSQTQEMIFHVVTLYWHWVDQFWF